MSRPERALERACQVVALLASLGFAASAFWELADSFGAGHFASASAVCTAAENMWRWGVAGPLPHALGRPPVASDFYCHHPWGIFWVSALFMKLFGHHAWACRLPAVLQSAATVPALYLAARALWSPVAGAIAALSFATLPIALSFADFNSLEVPVIFGVVLCIWGFARFRQSAEWRFGLLALGGLGYAVCCDWAAIVFALGLLSSLSLSLLLRRFSAPLDARRLVLFLGGASLLSALLIGGHLAAFAKLGQLDQLWAQGRLRSAGSELPLRLVLAARKFWLEVSFTPLAITLGKVALPVLIARVFWRRTELEALPVAVFVMAAFQYVVFKQGADIHIFWPHYFALYFALGWAGLTQTGLELTRRSSSLRGPWPSYGALVLGLGVGLLILPDGLRALRYAHRSGGRFNEKGHLIKPDKDKVAALEWLTARLPADAGVLLHPGMRQSLWVDWSLERPVITVNRLPTGPVSGRERYYVADMRFMSVAEQDLLARSHALTAIGPYLALDRASAPGALTAFAIERFAPSAFEAYWVSSSHAQRRVAPDPFLTWELRDRFNVTPNPPPASPPQSSEQLRVMHNIAVARGDAAEAARWLALLLAGTDPRHAQEFENGNALLATRLESGTSLVCTVYFRAAGPDPSEPELALRSQVTRAPAGSWVAPDETLAEVGMPFAIPTSRWKPGYVYASITEIIRRIGSERWYGTFRPARADGQNVAPVFDLLELD